MDYEFPSYVSEEAQNFINKFLKINPKHRIDLYDALKHNWI